MQPGRDFWQLLRRNHPPGTDALGPSEGQPGSSSPVQRRFSKRQPPAASWRGGLSGCPVETAPPPARSSCGITLPSPRVASGCQGAQLAPCWANRRLTLMSPHPHSSTREQLPGPWSPFTSGASFLTPKTGDRNKIKAWTWRLETVLRPPPPPAPPRRWALESRTRGAALHLGSDTLPADVFMG